MKIKILILLGLLAVNAPAQVARVWNINSTNSVAAESTNAINTAALSLAQATTLGVEIYGRLSTTNNDSPCAAVVTLETSVSGTNWTANVARLTFNLTGTNGGAAVSSTTLGGVPFVRIGSFENSATNGITNIVIWTYPKREF